MSGHFSIGTAASTGLLLKGSRVAPMVYRLSPSPVLGISNRLRESRNHPPNDGAMAECEDQVPESQLGRAQWLADELALCGHEGIAAIELLDALASVGLKLVPDAEGVSSHEYMGAHKSVIRSQKADLN